ncbi:MAG TPA: histone deacetylase, partial [Verrucomicrobiae bacterium]|nr:histone deacetylase [Verrucomicrobiae bacterium]
MPLSSRASSMAKMKIITDIHCAEYRQPGHPERPERILSTLESLRAQTTLPIEWAKPQLAEDEPLLRAHTPGHLRRLREPRDFDGDTPFLPDIERHARAAAGAALLAAEIALKGEMVFSLMRPPGHHAEAARAMGFCYLNNIAIAALHARSKGAKRVALFDFDVHHGNGTEAILMNQPGIAFYSVHQYPCYPGTGPQNVGNNCFNFPVAPQTPRDEYRRIFEKALNQLKKFKPDLVAVSAGFDAYARDPLAQETLEADDFHWLGSQIRALALPAFNVLEGGYSDDLPQLILAYL